MLLFLLLAATPAKAKEGDACDWEPPRDMHLWPFYTRLLDTDDLLQTHALFGLYGKTRQPNGYENGYCFPLYWFWDKNFLLVPLAWRFDDRRGVGPVWWGREYLHVFPFYWHWNVPPESRRQAGKGPENAAEQPDNANAPARSDTILFPLAWDVDRHKGVGPVWWGDNYGHFVPIYWRWDRNMVVAPLAWRINEHKGVGPVWWGHQYFHVFPLYWSWPDFKLLLPLASVRQDLRTRDVRVLWRLYHRHTCPDCRFTEVQPFFSVSKSAGITQFNLFWRLFEYRREADGSRTIRLFFSKRIKIGTEEEAEVANAE